MIRLFVIGESETEEAIVKRVLVLHLNARNVFPYAQSQRGGGRWARWQRFLDRLMRQEKAPECRFTTIFDLYAFRRSARHGRHSRRARHPQAGSKDRGGVAADAVPARSPARGAASGHPRGHRHHELDGQPIPRVVVDYQDLDEGTFPDIPVPRTDADAAARVRGTSLVRRVA